MLVAQMVKRDATAIGPSSAPRFAPEFLRDAPSIRDSQKCPLRRNDLSIEGPFAFLTYKACAGIETLTIVMNPLVQEKGLFTDVRFLRASRKLWLTRERPWFVWGVSSAQRATFNVAQANGLGVGAEYRCPEGALQL
jgi:hypothetical protein